METLTTLIPRIDRLEPALREGLAGAFIYDDDGFLRPDKLNATWSDRLRSWPSSVSR